MIPKRGPKALRNFLCGPGSRRVRQAAGFTVVELLLGLGIFAVMGTCVYVTYANAVRIDRESRHRSELAHGGYWALTALEEDLERVVPYRYFDQGKGEERPVFTGSEQAVAFVIEGPEGLQWVSYSLVEPQRDSVHAVALGQHFQKNTDQTIFEQSDARRQLIFTRRAAVFKGLPPADTKIIPSEILLGNISDRGVRFAYAKKKTEGETIQLSWVNAWNENGPPAAVRISLRLEDEQVRSVLEMERDVLLPAEKQE